MMCAKYKFGMLNVGHWALGTSLDAKENKWPQDLQSCAASNAAFITTYIERKFTRSSPCLG